MKTPSTSSQPPPNLSSPPSMDINEGHGGRNSHAGGSTRVTTRVSHLEEYRWCTQRNKTFPTSDSESSSLDDEESDSNPDTPSEFDLESDDESEDGDGVITAWELLGDDFAREAHSLGQFASRFSIFMLSDLIN